MKFFPLLMVLVVTTLTSCNAVFLDPGHGAGTTNPDGTGMLSVRITTGSDGSRSLSPSSAAIDSFDISGAGPNGAVFGPVNVRDAAYTSSTLQIGQWAITVTAKNASSQAVATGSGSVTVVSETNATLTITVNPLTGNGALSVQITWPDGSLVSPAFNASLVSSDGSSIPITLTVSGRTASYDNTSLSAGSYLLGIDVLDGTVIRHPILEGVRIFSGLTTTGTFDLTAYDLSKDSAARPVFSVAPGEYGSTQSVTITSSTPGASIRYTTNGSSPSSTVGRTLSSGGTVQIDSSTVLKAVAVGDGYNASSIVSGTYTITGSVAVPSVSPAEGLYWTAQSVTLSCSTPGALLLYTTDGVTPPAPGTSGTSYTGPITVPVNSTMTIMACAYLSDLTKVSNVTTMVYRVTDYTANPAFSHETGTYNDDLSIGITCATSGSSIYYTTDGSTPSRTNGTLYTGPVSVSASGTLKAIAVKTDWGDSAVVEKTYTMKTATPAFSVGTGTYNSEQSVTITTSTTVNTIYFTVNGDNPTAATGTVYSAPIVINGTKTLKAIAVRAGWPDSDMATASYTLKPLQPSFSVPSGDYFNASFPVTISSGTAGASIKYTFDGSVPSSTGAGTFGTSYTVNAAMTMKAVAIKSGWTDSDVAEAAYTVNRTEVTPADGSVTGPTPLFDWYDKTETSSWCVQVNSASDFLGTMAVNDSGVTASQYQVPSALSTGVWYWRISPDGGTTWGGAKSITVNDLLFTAGTSPSTSGDIDSTRSDGHYLHVNIYVYSGDNDTLYCVVYGYNDSTSAWVTLYSGTGGSRTVLDQNYSYEYSRIRVVLDDTEDNDTIYYTWDCSYR